MKHFNGQLKKRFEIKTEVIGPADGEVLEAKVFNRVIRRTEHGYELEADQRHSELIAEMTGMEMDGKIWW